MSTQERFFDSYGNLWQVATGYESDVQLHAFGPRGMAFEIPGHWNQFPAHQRRQAEDGWWYLVTTPEPIEVEHVWVHLDLGHHRMVTSCKRRWQILLEDRDEDGNHVAFVARRWAPKVRRWNWIAVRNGEVLSTVPVRMHGWSENADDSWRNEYRARNERFATMRVALELLRKYYGHGAVCLMINTRTTNAMAPEDLLLLTWANEEGSWNGHVYAPAGADVTVTEDRDEYGNGTVVYIVTVDDRYAKVVACFHDTRSIWRIDDPTGLIVRKEWDRE